MKTDPAQRSDADRASLRDHFLVSVHAATNSALAPLRDDLKGLDEQRAALAGLASDHPQAFGCDRVDWAWAAAEALAARRLS